MCGIIGLALGKNANLDPKAAFSIAEKLLLLSESRGKEAAGLAILLPDSIDVLRQPFPASEFLQDRAYREFKESALRRCVDGAGASAFGLIGHARLVTNGLQVIDSNNQPVAKGSVVCVHNGIVVNDASLWESEQGITRESDVDTEVITAILDARIRGGNSASDATQYVFSRIYGEASIAALFADRDELLLATNTGSIFIGANPAARLVFVASELGIARKLLASLDDSLQKGFESINQLKAGEGMVISVTNASLGPRFSLNGTDVPLSHPEPVKSRPVVSNSDTLQGRWKMLRRCTRCVLPETMPYIEFDSQGVCNYCKAYVTHRSKGREELERILDRYRSKAGQPDCIIAFSGGRDSSYALHLLKAELGMNPIAYTYDWGMVTDLARRNQARLCGKLGVEHIWVSADIKMKRRNVRKNVEAWLRQPDLGMVPLFMAGDKQFMYHANRLMKETGIQLMVYATNHFERTDFKTGFCRIRATGDEIKLNRLSLHHKVLLALYYVRNFLGNPGYLNASLYDTFKAFLSYYFQDQDFLYLFDYLDWDEETINQTLIEHYDWEFAKDTKTSWRIGDGTAPFYNYIYRTIAGFSEYETFRSNQVRAGVLEREEALNLILQENHARFDSIQEYCRMIGLDFENAIRVIDRVPKHY